MNQVTHLMLGKAASAQQRHVTILPEMMSQPVHKTLTHW
jgi:hypothetical protein